MPNPGAIFATLSRDHVFSKLDCSKGYWQIAMHTEDIEWVVFSSPSGLFLFRRMPFRLINAGTSYGRSKRKLLNGLTGVDNYVDDIVVRTQTWPEHLVVLREVFKRLMSAGITVKSSKCCLGYSKIYFVSHQLVCLTVRYYCQAIGV